MIWFYNFFTEFALGFGGSQISFKIFMARFKF